MQNFNFYNPTRIIFGKDSLNQLDALTPAGAKVLIVYGGGSAKKYGTIDKVKAALSRRQVHEFGGIEPNPHYETIIKAAVEARRLHIDFILAVGGGSVIDGAKFLTLAARHNGDPLAILRQRLLPPDFISDKLPLACVLTLPATGSEMNERCVISYGDAKIPIYCELLFPSFSILDPVLTFTLPSIQVANGIADAFAHVAEQYLTYPVEGRLQDRMAEGIMQTLIEVGPRTIACPEDYDARANMMWCAAMALNGLLCAGVPQDWTSHRIGHELTAMFGIDHGQTLSVVLPAALEVRREQKRAKLLQFAKRVWRLEQGDEDARISAAIQKTRDFFESLGIKTRLSAYGVGPDKIDALVANLGKHGWTALSATNDVTLDISKKILLAAL
jgi:NADP-dependent alcohol dehydrogenase